MKRTLKKAMAVTVLFLYLDQAVAVEFEKMGTAVGKVLGTTKATKAQVKVDGKQVTVYQAKGADGRTRYAAIQSAIYPPNCSHTWVIGINDAVKVEAIEVVEMACTHAYPTREPAWLKQFSGKGVADAKTLKSSTQTIGHATGSSELTADAVSIAIRAVGTLKKG